MPSKTKAKTKPKARSKALAKRKTYTEQTKREAMAAYAFTSGDKDRATKLLKENNIDVPFNTLRSWVQRHKDMYREVRSSLDEHTRALMADQHRRLGNSFMDVEEAGLAEVKRAIKDGDIQGKDLAKTLKDMAIASAVHTDKAERLNDRPTIVVQHDITDIKRALDKQGIELIEPIDAEAIEVDVLPA